MVAIGRPATGKIAASFPKGRKINLITYSWPRFKTLYRRGDLFILHVLKEGKLVRGDAEKWARLVRQFKVRTRFKREIGKNKKVIDFLLSDRSNLKSPIAFLTNFLRALKQVAIFRLAERREYIFSKDKAIRKVYPWVPNRILDGMLDAEYILTRENKLNHDKDLKRLARLARQLFEVAVANQRKIL